jgi:hypothetical protein
MLLTCNGTLPELNSYMKITRLNQVMRTFKPTYCINSCLITLTGDIKILTVDTRILLCNAGLGAVALFTMFSKDAIS